MVIVSRPWLHAKGRARRRLVIISQVGVQCGLHTEKREKKTKKMVRASVLPFFVEQATFLGAPGGATTARGKGRQTWKTTCPICHR
ncbi:hypothetical protein IF1G_02650 [Cordyceps javanica]|uniref:Uncharacterized protein n=1 Tax=Cordyceps javanica TaxID=43265 RepID=A0A545VA33_9HYPO|nr:hypothetical protein IF1G_02650 [Cordyceps javanica]